LFGDPLLAEISIRSERTTFNLLARLLLLARFTLGKHKMRPPRLDEVDDVSFEIHRGELVVVTGPVGAGKSVLVSLLTLEQRPIAPSNGTPPVRVFGRQNWDLFELRSQLGIISADLHQHFVSGNSEGSITAEAAVLSAFLSSYGILRYGAVTDAIKEITKKEGIFVYGISDKQTGGLDVQLPNGKVAPVFAANLSENLPEPFKSEPTALSANNKGTRMHHKFVVIDFDKPTARVYMGSYNFSKPADNENGENLLLIKDRRIAVSYMIQALTIFDHYHFRVLQAKADASDKPIQLKKAPKTGQKPWWDEDYTDPRKILDRELFA